MVELPEHSPLGGSGASRWIKCPGSVSNSEGCVDEESEFAALGTAAHALGEHCLTWGTDAWTHMGCPIIGGMLDGSGDNIPEDAILVDKDMADAVQTYLNAVREWHPDRNQSNFFVERGFMCSSIHKFFYGRADAVYIDATFMPGLQLDEETQAECICVQPSELEKLSGYAAPGEDVLATAHEAFRRYANKVADLSSGRFRKYFIGTEDGRNWYNESVRLEVFAYFEVDYI